MRDFKKYDVWKISHEFTLEVYNTVDSFPTDEKFGIISQITRAAVSIPTNIAEGCGRDSDSEFSRFLTIALGSASEVEYLLILSKDLDYLSKENSQRLIDKINLIKRKTYNLKQKLKTQ
ncbi:four helix bundle protein [Wenyingzhuangia sp. IMCC45574]